MSRTVYKSTLLFLVVVLTAGVQMGSRFSAQGVVKAQGDSAVYLPLIVREGEEEPPSTGLRRVNLPYFSQNASYGQAAVFWFGQVTSDQNYADARMGYSPTELTVWLSAFDRRVWYNKDGSSAALATLTEWDGLALYLNPQGGDARQPGSQSYKFVAQFYDSGSSSGANHKAAYRGNGADWQSTLTTFTTTTIYRGNGPNDDQDDQGWLMTLHIPFSSLGLSSAPAKGTVWNLAVDLYDRDSQAGPANAVKTWPSSPDQYGEAAFGVPGYTPDSYTSPSTPVVIRQGLNGTTVTDAMVGGSSTCGDGLNRWTQWGSKNWFGETLFVVQNQSDVADFPCFSKEYLIFPLSKLPKGKVIVSAKLGVYQFGNSDPSAATDSYIQVMRVAEDWDPRKITWNTAPLALENYSGEWVGVLGPPWPLTPYTFELSRAAADAYQEGQPLRIVLYSADSDMHSGKYFVSSNQPDWGAEQRPRLEVVWGEPK